LAALETLVIWGVARWDLQSHLIESFGAVDEIKKASGQTLLTTRPD
jgi:hypothetical protein